MFSVEWNRFPELFWKWDTRFSLKYHGLLYIRWKDLSFGSIRVTHLECTSQNIRILAGLWHKHSEDRHLPAFWWPGKHGADTQQRHRAGAHPWQGGGAEVMRCCHGNSSACSRAGQVLPAGRGVWLESPSWREDLRRDQGESQAKTKTSRCCVFSLQCGISKYTTKDRMTKQKMTHGYREQTSGYWRGWW